MDEKDLMNRHESEADARIVIDELLRQSGWDPVDKSMVRTEDPGRDLACRQDSSTARARKPFRNSRSSLRPCGCRRHIRT